MMFDLVVSSGRGGVAIVSVIGELDISTAPKLRQQLIQAIADLGPSPKIVLDLAGTDYLDSTGLGVILGGVKRTRLQGGDLALSGAEPQVRRDFEITRLIQVLPIHESVDAAIDALLVE